MKPSFTSCGCALNATHKTILYKILRHLQQPAMGSNQRRVVAVYADMVPHRQHDATVALLSEQPCGIDVPIRLCRGLRPLSQHFDTALKWRQICDLLHMAGCVRRAAGSRCGCAQPECWCGLGSCQGSSATLATPNMQAIACLHPLRTMACCLSECQHKGLVCGDAWCHNTRMHMVVHREHDACKCRWLRRHKRASRWHRTRSEAVGLEKPCRSGLRSARMPWQQRPTGTDGLRLPSLGPAVPRVTVTKSDMWRRISSRVAGALSVQTCCAIAASPWYLSMRRCASWCQRNRNRERRVSHLGACSRRQAQ